MTAVTDTIPLDEAPEALSDEELTLLALAADPDQPIAEDAVPVGLYLATVENLPEWYMPPARARLHGRLARAVVIGLVGSFLAIEAFGLCSTYGQFPFH